MKLFNVVLNVKCKHNDNRHKLFYTINKIHISSKNILEQIRKDFDLSEVIVIDVFIMEIDQNQSSNWLDLPIE